MTISQTLKKTKRKDIGSKSSAEFKPTNASEFPEKSEIDFLVTALLSFHCDQYEVKIYDRDMKFSIYPVACDKEQFDIVRNLESCLNYNIKKKESLYHWMLSSNYKVRSLLKDSGDNKVREEQLLKQCLLKNDFKFVRPSLLEDTFCLQPGLFASVGLYGKGRKALDSLEVIMDTYWSLYKLTRLNINYSNHSSAYANSQCDDGLVEYHEKVLNALKAKLKN